MPRAVVWCALLATFLLGLFVGTSRTFDLSDKLTTGNLLSALVSVVVALALGVFFQRNFSESRAEKDLLIGQVKQTTDGLSVVRALFLEAYHSQAPQDHDPKLLAALRSASNLFISLERACCEGRNYQSSHLVNARSQFRIYRRHLTDRAFVGKPYSAAAYSASETAFSAMQHELFMFSFFVNKR